MMNDKHGNKGFSRAGTRLPGDPAAPGSTESLAQVDDRNWRITFLLTATIAVLVAVRALLVVGLTVAGVGSGYPTPVVVASVAVLVVVAVTAWLLVRARRDRRWPPLATALGVCLAGLVAVAVAGRL
ncbi:hypothetical protein [Streptomyces sp. NPDC050145]|uniref:hypothetical protein n=1 Tax=Streptomyces sp. NPDC050145 TaxID=3365602 RepID=UPI0037B661EC